MKRLLVLLLLVCDSAWAVTFSDIQIGWKQIGDSQWNVGACMTTTTCVVNSESVGNIRGGWGFGSQRTTMTQGQYIKYAPSGDSTLPWNATLYNSNGTVNKVLGKFRVLIAGEGYMFITNDPVNAGNGHLISTQSTLTGGAVTFTGTHAPTAAEMDALANSYYSTTWLAAGTTYTPPPPSLCCGGSSVSFNADTTNLNKLNTFVNRNTADSKVYVEQIGNSNTITVNQSGTKNNDVSYSGSGSFNTVSITQSGNNTTQANYVGLTLNGNSNAVDITQTSTGGGKGVFATIQDNNNDVSVLQKDAGSHYLNLNLSGGSKTVDVTQQGSASHMADITLSGAGSRTLNLTQQGTTQQFYSINSTCASNCQAITVTQGQ